MDHFRSLNINIPDGSTLRLDERNETVFFLSGKNLSETMQKDTAFAELRSKSLFPQIAIAFISAHHNLFKLNDPFHELQTESVTTDDLGYTHIKFQQVYETLPILNAEIIVHLNRLNQVHLINGRYVPTPAGLDTHPAISRDQAVDRISKNFPDQASSTVQYVAKQIIYITADQKPCLAYQVAPHSSKISGHVYVIDARTGDVLTKISTVYDMNP